MKKHVIFLILFFLCKLSFSQVSGQQINFDFKIAYCIGSGSATVWEGKNIAIVIEGESPSNRNNNIMTRMLGVFDDIYDKYVFYTGLNNLPLSSGYNGKMVIEIVEDNCGAGGLAGHGSLGMSTGKFFLDQFYNNIQANNISVPQVFLYEINRNFWLPSFNDKFDWAMNNESANWGWWTVGMNNAQAFIVPNSLNIGLDYYGNDINYWENRMVNHIETYMNNAQYNFDYGWRQSLMPWSNTDSINDLMTGFLIYSYINFGGDNFMHGFYEQIQNNQIPNRSNVFAYQECRDNIYKVWSYAANRDLLSFFRNNLRWEISQTAINEVQSKFNGQGSGPYCSSASLSSNDEYISNVQLNSINNNSGARLYSDFTSISTDLVEGQSYTIAVTPTWTSSVFAEAYSVWIDYNNNGNFTDGGELVWFKTSSTDTYNSGTFTVPTGTSKTSVRMRVSMKYFDVPAPCETFSYGEVEDYTINLKSGNGGGSDLFYIVNRETGKKLSVPNLDSGQLLKLAPTSQTNDYALWRKVDVNNQYFYLQNVASGMYFRPINETSGSRVIQRPTSFSGTWTQWEQVPSSNGFFYLKNRKTGMYIRPDTGNDGSNIVLRPTSWSGGMTQYQFVAANNRFAGRTEVASGDNLKTVTQTTSLHNIKLYPNPAKNSLNIEMLDGKLEQLRVFSVTGKKVYSANNVDKALTIDVSQFTPGIYFVKIITNGKAVTERFIRE